MGGAAFFDLDRTVLSGASGPAINAALVEEGLVARRRIPGEGLLFRAYNAFGENLASMALARSAALVARGWPVDAARRAGRRAAERLQTQVSGYVRPLLEDHRRAGQPLVLATTTPYDLVAPLAEHLGMDDIVATRYAVRAGRYTGGLDGEFVWSVGKLGAVRRWAGDHGVALGESFLYSDSAYDLPLFFAVGHPVAVNPDPRLRAVAMTARWPVLHLDVPPGVPKLAGLEPFDVVALFARPEMFPYARFDIGPLDDIPVAGPAVIVANHRSYFDVAALGVTVARRGRPLRFMGKKEVFDAPVVGPLARALGGIRVDRGSGSDEPLREAARALEAGDLVAVLPQGTIPRGRAFFDPVLQGRTGAARLAAMTGAPVVPVGVWNSEMVWPRSSRLPHVASVVRPPTVRVRVGPPVQLELSDARADTEAIMSAIVRLLPPAARLGRPPTARQLARTYPPGTPRTAVEEDAYRSNGSTPGGVPPASGRAARNQTPRRAATRKSAAAPGASPPQKAARRAATRKSPPAPGASPPQKAARKVTASPPPKSAAGRSATSTPAARRSAARKSARTNKAPASPAGSRQAPRRRAS